MNRCIAYLRSRSCPQAWRQCKNRAVGGGFCRKHLNVISGVYLGLGLAEVPRRRTTREPVTNAGGTTTS
jgi:hypothetical protein